MKQQAAIIGGGAAGLMAACTAARRGFGITVFEKMPRPARKILVTGKGRCNVTNATDLAGLIAHVPHNGRFLYSAFSAFDANQTVSFFEAAGVPLKTERGNRVFPQSEKAMDIADALVNTAKRLGVRFVQATVKQIAVQNGAVAGLETTLGRFYPFGRVILATGGCSYPSTGSTGDGFAMAGRLGHTVFPPRAALTGLTVPEEFCSYAAGLTLKNVKLTVTEQGAKKPCYSEQGELLFTHTGISGPLVLSASSAMRGQTANGALAVLDFKPALQPAQLENRLQRDFNAGPNKALGNVLTGLLPQKMIAPVLRAAHLPPSLKANAVQKGQRAALAAAVKALPLHITGFGPLEQAVVTRGGVSVKEVDPKTMQSRLVRGLYFAGELLDVDAFTGGFNLQIAFATGHCAGAGLIF